MVQLFADRGDNESGPAAEHWYRIPPPPEATGTLGAFMGVYVPTIEQMWGVIIFIRCGWGPRMRKKWTIWLAEEFRERRNHAFWPHGVRMGGQWCAGVCLTLFGLAKSQRDGLYAAPPPPHPVRNTPTNAFRPDNSLLRRFGELLGKCGVIIALAVTMAFALTAMLTACSISALSSNGIFTGSGGAFHLLTRSLGPALGMMNAVWSELLLSPRFLAASLAVFAMPMRCADPQHGPGPG